MSLKKDFRDDLRKVTIVRNRSLNNTAHNLSCINDISQDFECLKISILNKASRVSGEFDKVTLGPRADYENGNVSDNLSEVKTPKSNNNTPNKKTPTRNNLTFSIKKILLENEIIRKEKVKQAVEKKRKEMEASQNKIHAELSELLEKMILKKEKETAEQLLKLEAEEEQLALQMEQNIKNELERQKLQESEEILTKIIPLKESFHAMWKDIADIYRNCKDQNSAVQLLNSYTEKLKELSSQWDPINERANTGDLTLKDLRMVELVVQSNTELFQSFQLDINQIEVAYNEEIIKREAELKQAELALQEEAKKLKEVQEAENAAKAEQIKVEQQYVQNPQHFDQQNYNKPEVDSASQPPPYLNTPQEGASVATDVAQLPTISENKNVSSEYPDVESFKLYIDSKQFLENYLLLFKEFVVNEGMKKFKRECQKTLNIIINSISNLSREQLVDKYNKLKSFLSGNGNPNILLNPQAETYSKNLLAQKILDQGDTAISSKPELAFPFAAIVVALWNDWPDFGQILLAKFRTISPFFVPLFLMQTNDQTVEEYYKSLGYKYNEDGSPEDPDKFYKRLGGIMYLYATILITKQRQGINKPHPHGLGNAWRWLAATLNIEPRSDIANISATLIYVILEVTGSDMWKTYPNQFPKLLYILNNVYYEKLKNFDLIHRAPISRLGDFLATALKNGSIPPPKGQLPSNFW